MCCSRTSLLCLLMIITIVSATNILSSGGSLYNEDMMVSENNRYFLRFEKSGDLVLYDKKDMKHKVWSTETAGSASKLVYMQPDGNLVLYTDGGVATWHIGTTAFYNRGDYLKLENDGTLTVRHEDTNTIVWSSKFGKSN